MSAASGRLLKSTKWPSSTRLPLPSACWWSTDGSRCRSKSFHLLRVSAAQRNPDFSKVSAGVLKHSLTWQVVPTVFQLSYGNLHLSSLFSLLAVCNARLSGVILGEHSFIMHYPNYISQLKGSFNSLYVDLVKERCQENPISFFFLAWIRHIHCQTSTNSAHKTIQTTKTTNHQDNK